jgi:hypothetical protein
VSEIDADLGAIPAEDPRDTERARLLAERERAIQNARTAQQIELQWGWLLAQTVEANRLRLSLEQLQFLAAEAQGKIEALTAQGDALNEQVVAAESAVRVALATGDTATALRNQEFATTAGQTLRQVPLMIEEHSANRAAAEAQIPAVERDLALAEVSCDNARTEIERLANLPDGTPWDEPIGPARGSDDTRAAIALAQRELDRVSAARQRAFAEAQRRERLLRGFDPE